MPNSRTKRSGGKDSYAGKYDGSKFDWKSRTTTNLDGTKETIMVPGYSKPKLVKAGASVPPARKKK